MIPSAFAKDDVETAAEARARLLAGHARRRASYERRPVAPPPPPPAPPVRMRKVESPAPKPAPQPQSTPPAQAEWRAPSFITIRAVITAACAHFFIPQSVLISPQRREGLALKRQVAMFMAMAVTGKSLPEIGRAFGRDHTTILYAVHKIRRLLDAGEPEILAAREAILERLGLPPEYALSRRDSIEWTAEDIAILEAGWNVRDVKDIAAELKRSIGAVASKASKRGLSPRRDVSPRRVRWPLWNERLAQLAAEGLSSRKIAIQISEEAETYVGKGSILHRLNKLGIRLRGSK